MRKTVGRFLSLHPRPDLSLICAQPHPPLSPPSHPGPPAECCRGEIAAQRFVNDISDRFITCQSESARALSRSGLEQACCAIVAAACVHCALLCQRAGRGPRFVCHLA